MRLVLDTSAAANLILGTPDAQRVGAALTAADIVIAPMLYQSEIANTLWKAVRFGGLAEELAQKYLEEALALVDEFIPDDQLMPQALHAAVRNEHPVYDMVFLVLAQRFACRLLSADKKLIALANSIDTTMALP